MISEFFNYLLLMGMIAVWPAMLSPVIGGIIFMIGAICGVVTLFIEAASISLFGNILVYAALLMLPLRYLLAYAMGEERPFNILKVILTTITSAVSMLIFISFVTMCMGKYDFAGPAKIFVLIAKFADTLSDKTLLIGLLVIGFVFAIFDSVLIAKISYKGEKNAYRDT